ncbi:MAG: PTS fructose transporter subunit IIA [Alphaproteobacteria bacterium]|nr:PTS fructose transporter subunit IIA [Alphaproteobacteria bacterium]
MIGLVLVTHGRLALEFLAAMEHVVGPQAQIRTVCIDADDDMERRRGDIVEAAKGVDTGDGVILVTDMFGGTPSNLAISAMQKGTVEVIAGMNVPMLIKLAELRETTTVSDAVRQAQDAGRKYIAVASALLDVGG